MLTSKQLLRKITAATKILVWAVIVSALCLPQTEGYAASIHNAYNIAETASAPEGIQQRGKRKRKKRGGKAASKKKKKRKARNAESTHEEHEHEASALPTEHEASSGIADIAASDQQDEQKSKKSKRKKGKGAPVEVQLDFDTEDGIYWEQAGKAIVIPQFDHRPEYDSVKVRFTLRSDSLSSRVYWDTTVTIEVGDEAYIPLRFREPGFSWAQAEAYDGRTLLAYRLQKVGWQPQWFFPAVGPPADIRTFWRSAKEALAQVPKDYKLKPGPRHRWPSMQVYAVTIPSTDGVMLHGWLTVPKSSGLHPVILELPPYGNTMKPDLETRDMAVLRLDVRGHGRSRKQVNPGFPGFLVSGVADKETYIYKGVVQDCLAALEFLKQHPSIDTKRMGVMGVSQGGGLASMVACLDSSLKAMAVSVPFMCNWSRAFTTAPWPKRDFVKWVQEDEASRDMESVLKVLSYFDPCNLSAGCKASVFLAVGLQDMTCPPDGAFAWYNTMTQYKESVVYKDGHHILPGVRAKMMSFLRSQLKG